MKLLKDILEPMDNPARFKWATQNDLYKMQTSKHNQTRTKFSFHDDPFCMTLCHMDSVNPRILIYRDKLTSDQYSQIIENLKTKDRKHIVPISDIDTRAMRYFTSVELMRLNGWQDEYAQKLIYVGITNAEICAHVGNSMVVPCVEHVLQPIVKNFDRRIKVATLFSGIGAPEMALKNLGVDHEIVFACEYDEDAVISYNILHDSNIAATDIEDVKELPEEIDLLIMGPPCQDISKGGKGHGFRRVKKKNGRYATRSALMWRINDFLEDAKRNGKPLIPYIIVENVDAIISKRYLPTLLHWKYEMENLGYMVNWRILDATRYSVPQKRKRFYCTCILR